MRVQDLALHQEGIGVEHDVVNANDTEYAFVEIELKA